MEDMIRQLKAVHDVMHNHANVLTNVITKLEAMDPDVILRQINDIMEGLEDKVSDISYAADCAREDIDDVRACCNE